MKIYDEEETLQIARPISMSGAKPEVLCFPSRLQRRTKSSAAACKADEALKALGRTCGGNLC